MLLLKNSTDCCWHANICITRSTGDCKIIGNRAKVFNHFSGSKLVRKSVENCWACPNYFAIGSSIGWFSCTVTWRVKQMEMVHLAVGSKQEHVEAEHTGLLKNMCVSYSQYTSESKTCSSHLKWHIISMYNKDDSVHAHITPCKITNFASRQRMLLVHLNEHTPTHAPILVPCYTSA